MESEWKWHLSKDFLQLSEREQLEVVRFTALAIVKMIDHVSGSRPSKRARSRRK